MIEWGQERVDIAARARFHFYFYEHTLPAPSGTLREDFSLVVLRVEDGEFKKPDWQHFPVIPHAIQSAHFDLAATGLILGLPLVAAE